MEDIGKRASDALSKLPANVTQRVVADTIGMTPDALSRSLNGSRRFSAMELAALSDLLEVDLHWLITGEPDPFATVVAARKHYDFSDHSRRVPDMDNDEAVHRDIALAYRQAYENLGAAPSTLPRDADEARQELGPDFVRPFADRLEENFNIDVVRVSNLSTSWSLTIADRSIIVLAATGNWFHENWSIAHELGHLVLGHLSKNEVMISQTVDPEASANSFAAQLLMPAQLLRQVNWDSMSVADYASCIWNWGVSTGAAGRRMSALGIHPPRAIGQWSDQSTQRLLRWHWSGNDPFADEITRRMDEAAARRFPRALQTAHVELVERGVLGKQTLAWMLGVDADALDIDAPSGDDWIATDELAQALEN